MIEGSVSKVGERIRIAVQLFDCADAEILWTQTYDQENTDIFALQDEVAGRIVQGSHVALWARMQRRYPQDGLWHLNERTLEDNAKSVAIFREWAESDPTALNPRWMILTAYLQRLQEGWAESIDATLAEMERSARECLDLDYQSDGCHFAMATFHLVTGERDKMIGEMKRMLELSGYRPDSRAIYGFGLAVAGLSQEAIENLEEAIRHSSDDPELWRMHGWLGWAHFAAGRYTEARDLTRRSLEYNANDEFNSRASNYQVLAASNAQLGQLDEARDALDEAKQLRPGLTSEWVSLMFSTADADYRNRVLAGLRLAGLEE